METAQTEPEKQALHLELGELELLRGDFYLARDHFRSAGGRQPVRALAGEAAAWGGLNDEARCAELFGKALAAAQTPVARGRVELQWTAFARQFGRIDRAIELVESARLKIANKDSKDFGTAAASFVVLADLLLLDARRKPALKTLAGASVFFYRLKDTARALPAYSREVLVLLRDGTKEDIESAVQRLTPMQDMAESVKSKSLRSVERCTHAMVSAAIGDPESALAKLGEAADLAHDAGDWQREATALSVRAFLRDLIKQEQAK